MNFAQTVSEDRRFLILKALEKANGYTASALLLKSFLLAFGHSLSHDALDTELSWLVEQGLIEVRTDGTASIAKLSTRGLDVSVGAAQAPGVRRPRPGEL